MTALTCSSGKTTAHPRGLEAEALRVVALPEAEALVEAEALGLPRRAEALSVEPPAAEVLLVAAVAPVAAAQR